VTNNYTYSNGDRLTDRNTYFYSPSTGNELITAWQNSRKQKLVTLHENSSKPECEITEEKSINQTRAGLIDTDNLICCIVSAIDNKKIDKKIEERLEQLLRKFEVFKRFHSSYDGRFRATEKFDYFNSGTYISAAEMFLKVYNHSNRIQYLNVAMKIIDTLCSRAFTFYGESATRLIELIDSEADAVRVFRAQVENET
jgi:hypothetical protein